MTAKWCLQHPARRRAQKLARRSEKGSRKLDDDVRGGVREILAGSPEDHGFPRPTWTLEEFCAAVDIHLDPKPGPDRMLAGTRRLVLLVA
jgi:hypothetical protein